MIYFPYQPIKNKAFRLYYTMLNSDHKLQNPDIIQFSKDGGSFNSLTFVPILTGRGYIDLTADNMNANTILIWLRTSLYVIDHSVVIYTIADELSAIPTKDASLAEKITAIWQYLFFKREVTNDSEILYKDDNTTELGSGTIVDNGTTVTKDKISS